MSDRSIYLFSNVPANTRIDFQQTKYRYADDLPDRIIFDVGNLRVGQPVFVSTPNGNILGEGHVSKSNDELTFVVIDLRYVNP